MTKATVVRDPLGYALEYRGAMCSDGARRTAYPLGKDMANWLMADVSKAVKDHYGALILNETVYVNVWDHNESDYFMVFGRLVWNGSTDEADCVFLPFFRDLGFDNPTNLLPAHFVWGAAKDFHGPFIRSLAPEGWQGETTVR